MYFCTIFRVLLKATMEPYLPMARQAVESHLPCRALQILLLKEELFPGELIFDGTCNCKFCTCW